MIAQTSCSPVAGCGSYWGIPGCSQARWSVLCCGSVPDSPPIRTCQKYLNRETFRRFQQLPRLQDQTEHNDTIKKYIFDVLYIYAMRDDQTRFVMDGP